MYRRLSVILLAALLAGVLGGCAQSPVLKVKQTFAMKAQADAYYAKRDCANAVPLYQQVNEEMPEYSEGWLRIGNCDVYLNKLDDAVLAYRQALERDPKYLKAWYNLAHVQARMLGETVTEMYRNVDMADPMAADIRRFAMDVLDAFEQPANPQDGNPPLTNGAGDDAYPAPGLPATSPTTSPTGTAGE
ncbi:MAG: tetratricopeptide repeat protein [Candidatus Thiodiazotropha sp.]